MEALGERLCCCSASTSGESADRHLERVDEVEHSKSQGAIYYFKMYLTRLLDNRMPMAPWGLGTVITVMTCWIIGFWISAYTIVPAAMRAIQEHIGTYYLLSSSSVHALRHLLLDISQLAFIWVLFSRALKDFSTKGFFRVSVTRAKDWMPIVLMGFSLFPLIDWLHSQMIVLVSSGSMNAAATSASASMFGGESVVTKVLWFTVLGLIAPVWEEIMFRGFLLPSLARLSSPRIALLCTSVLFALVHFTKEGFVPLLILGVIFGVSYCATSNLLPAMLLHSLWNMCLLYKVATFA